MSQAHSTITNSTRPTSYAHITRPKREYAIIITTVEGLTNDDYLDGVETLISLENVRAVSKLSSGRVCIYLNSRSLVDELKNKKVSVKNHLLELKPYISDNKRVVISNVHPFIPDETIIDALKIHDIKILSHITPLRAGLVKPGRAHILSFRRQFYIRDEDERKLPDSLQIHYDNTAYWTFLSTDSTACFHCKQTGHIARNCPSAVNKHNNNTQVLVTEFESSQTQINNSISQSTHINNNHHNSPGQSSNANSASAMHNNKSEEEIPTNKGIKRPSPPSTISDSNPSNNENINEDLSKKSNDTEFKTPKTKKKKIKPTASNLKSTTTVYHADNEINAPPDSALTPAKCIFEDPENNFRLDYYQFESFLEKTKGRHDAINVAMEFTSDPEDIIEIIDAAYHHILDRSVKARFTKIKKKLLKETPSTSECDSDMSQT